MSQNNTIKPEFKTVRIPAFTYFKIAELAALIALIRGESTSISDTTTTAINTLYNALYPSLMAVANDPKQREKWRNWFLENKKSLQELVKDIKITE